MTQPQTIPVFTLFGETDSFPDVIHCERIVDRARAHGWQISAHRHAQMAQLFVIEDGNARALVDGAKITLAKQSFLFVPPQAVHSFDFAQGTEGYVVSFPMNIVNSVGPATSEFTDSLAKPFSNSTNKRLLSLVVLLSDILSEGGTYRIQTVIGLAHAILALVAQTNISTASDASHHDTRLNRLDQLIRQNLSNGWGATDYASAMAITTGHLSRLCRGHKGVSASVYIETAIMEEACRLLAFTQLTISEIGYRLGYDDPSYFTRRFRVVQDQTPSEYRRRFVS